MAQLDQPLFDLPKDARRPLARVVLISGPSGAGKSRLTRRLGWPAVTLDDFYRDGREPGLPRRHGMVDWDSPATWNQAAAVAALTRLCTTGEAEVPTYDIPSNAAVGSHRVELEGEPFVLAEGIFAAELVTPLRDAGLLADALCIIRPRAQTFWFRLMRDLDEGRKPPMNLVRRGVSLAAAEPRMIAALTAKGCRQIGLAAAEEQMMLRRARALAGRS